MSHYKQTLVLDAKPAAVYAALTTPNGLSGWWTEQCDVPARAGETIHVRFGRTYKELRIERLDPAREVRWRCTSAHIAKEELTQKDEWVGTEIVFRLAPQADGRTRLDFEHIGLVPDFECYNLCSNGWQYFLRSLQAFIATGRGTPYEIKAPVAA